MEPTLQNAVRMARYGRKDWLVWTDQAGQRRAERKTAASLKQCLLDCGTKGNWTLVCANTGQGMKGFWYMGINMLAQMKRGY